MQRMRAIDFELTGNMYKGEIINKLNHPAYSSTETKFGFEYTFPIDLSLNDAKSIGKM